MDSKKFNFLCDSSNWKWDKKEMGGFDDMINEGRAFKKQSFFKKIDLSHYEKLKKEIDISPDEHLGCFRSTLYGEPVTYFMHKCICYVYAKENFWRKSI